MGEYAKDYTPPSISTKRPRRTNQRAIRGDGLETLEVLLDGSSPILVS